MSRQRRSSSSSFIPQHHLLISFVELSFSPSLLPSPMELWLVQWTRSPFTQLSLLFRTSRRSGSRTRGCSLAGASGRPAGPAHRLPTVGSPNEFFRNVLFSRRIYRCVCKCYVRERGRTFANSEAFQFDVFILTTISFTPIRWFHWHWGLVAHNRILSNCLTLENVFQVSFMESGSLWQNQHKRIAKLSQRV